MKRRPLVLLRILTLSQVILSLGLLGAGILYIYGAKNLQKALNSTNDVFSLLTQAQQQLAGRTEQLTNSPNLKHSLEKNLPHLLQGELRSGLRPGILDAVTLSSDRCELEIKMAVQGHKAPNCQPQALTPIDGIRNLEDFPVFFSVRPVFYPESQTKYWIQAHLDLNEAWFNQHPEIYQEFSEQSLFLLNQHNKNHDLSFLIPLLSESTRTVMGNSGLTLSTSDLVKFFSLKAQHDLNQFLPGGLWVILGLQALLGLFLLVVQKLQSTSETVALINLSMQAKKILPDLSIELEKLDFADAFQQVLNAFKKRFEEWEKQNSKTLEKISNQTVYLQNAQSKLREMREKREDSIYGSVDRKIMLFFIEKSLRSLACMTEESANLKSKIIGIQNSTLNGLNGILNQWTHNIEMRGARKFIRSLDETEYKSGVSNLEQQLATIIISNREISQLLEHNQSRSNLINLISLRQSAAHSCLKQLIQKRPLRCDEFYRHLLALNDFYNDASVGNINLKLIHNFSAPLPLLTTEVLPILHYFYFLLHTTDDVLKMPSIMHKIELSDASLVHAFYFTSHADWIQRQVRKNHSENAMKAMQEWAEHCNIKIHVIPQGRDSCVLIIRERLQAEAPTVQTQHYPRKDDPTQGLLQ